MPLNWLKQPIEDKKKSDMNLRHVHLCTPFGGRCGLLSRSDGNPSRRGESSEAKPEGLVWTDRLIFRATGGSTPYWKSGLHAVQAQFPVSKLTHRYLLRITDLNCWSNLKPKTAYFSM